MKIIDYIQISMNIILIALMTAILVVHYETPEVSSNSNNTTIQLQQPYFFLTEVPNDSLVLKALEYYEVKHSKIVLAQAVLETGHYRSKLCKENNNLFGLYNSSKKEYFKFSHWTESVKAYKTAVQYKYNGGNYYHFLDSIGYAEDSLYISKVKNIVKRYE